MIPAPVYVHDLPRDGTMGFRPGRGGLALRCRAGIVVVTQKGDREDHVLRPGEEFHTARRGLVVAWALTACAFAILGGMRTSPPVEVAAAA